MKPIFDNVLVKRDTPEETTEGGIIIPTSSQDKQYTGKVVSIGDGKPLANGKIHPCSVSVGDRVIFGDRTGVEVEVNNEQLLVMKETDILGVIE